jgi:hypothetical protein
MRMWRVPKVLLLTGAIALSLPFTLCAQRGGHAGGGEHAGGFGGGHASGFSGSGTGARGFGRGFSGSAPRSFPAPPVNFSSGQIRYAPSGRPYANWVAPRSPFGQLNAPANRGAYPGRAGAGVAGNRGGGYPGRRYPNRPPYRRGVAVYASPYYATPWFGAWPYFGNWNDFGFDDSDASQAGGAPDQSYAQDQSYAPDAPAYEDQGRQSYQSGFAASAAPSSEPALIIVYKDGHSQQVHNYALTPTTLLLLDGASSGLTRRVSLDEIDLVATRRANLASGIDFSPPVRN